MLYVLDASALLNEPNFEFESKHSYVTTPEVLSEWKSWEVRNLVDNALHHKRLRVQEANWKYLGEIKEIIRVHGFERISYPDQTILALALEFSKSKKRFQVLTDDYSIQNFLALLKLPFGVVIMKEIPHIIAFKRFCSNCGKSFSEKTTLRECDFCGGKIRRKPVKIAETHEKSIKSKKVN